MTRLLHREQTGTPSGESVEVRVSNGQPATAWRKSSRSHITGNCVEVAALSGHVVGVRDGKLSGGHVLRFSVAQWSAFIEGVHYRV